MILQEQLRRHPVAIADDQQSLTVNGYAFSAKDGTPGRCLGCSFIDGFSCSAWRNEQSPHCQPHQRSDGRSIVWVKR